MFSTSVRGGKFFAAEQKLRELKKRIFKLKILEKNIKGKWLRPYEIIKKSAENMNSMPSAWYKQTPNKIEKKTLSSETDKKKFNFSRLEKIGKEKTRLKKFDKRNYQIKKLKLRSPLEVGEEVLILASWIRKKDNPGRFYKSSMDSKPYSDNKETFSIRNRQKIEENFF